MVVKMKKEVYESVKTELMNSVFASKVLPLLNEEEKSIVVENHYIAEVIERIGCRIQYSTEYTPGFIDEVWRIAKLNGDKRLEALKANNKYLLDYLANMKSQIEEVQSNI